MVFGWLTVLLVTDPSSGLGEQLIWGAATWGVLLWLLRAETPLVRAQVAVVVAFAPAVEYIFSLGLEVYVYRLDNIPAFVSPAHGLVYLCALALGRSSVVHRWRVALVAGGYGWFDLAGLTAAPALLRAWERLTQTGRPER